MFIGSPSVILPVVSIVALTPIMFNIVERAPKITDKIPQRFIVEDEEVSIQLVVVDQLHPDLILPMSERAENVILTVPAIIRVVCAELRLILLQAI